MKMVRFAAVLLVAGIASVAPLAGAPPPGTVTVDGQVVRGADSTIDNSIEVLELREGGESLIRLLPGRKRYGVCVVARAPVPVFDAVFPVAAETPRFRVGVEDGRTFSNCLLASLKAEGEAAKRRLTYCLRCEDVTAP